MRFKFEVICKCEGINFAFFGETDASIQEVLDRVNWTMSHGTNNPYSIQSVVYQPIKNLENETSKEK